MPRHRNARAYDSRRRTGQQKAHHDRWGYVLIGVSILTIGAFGAAVAAVSGPKLDPSTGCPPGQGAPPAHTLILVDETDSLTRQELGYARALIRTEYQWLPMGGRLTVRNIVADPNAAEEISVCRMSDGGDVLGIFKNPKKVKRDFQKTAGAKLDKLYADLAVAPPQDASPILEFLSQAMDRPDFGMGVPTRRLVVLSDFAQHSDLVSHYGPHPNLTLGEDVRDELWRDMNDVEARLHYIPRRKLAQLQGARHRAFWTSHLRRMHANALIGHDLLLGEDRTREITIDETL